MITNMKDAFSVKGKNVLVTGGNRVVGLGIVQAFAQSEANISSSPVFKGIFLEK